MCGTVIACVLAPPSLQPLNAYGEPPMVCGVAAVIAVVAPRMNRNVNGAVPVSAPAESCAPVGVLFRVRSTVLGCSATVVEACRPCESVAVRTSSTCDGKSWSGPMNEPEATPFVVVATQGQWDEEALAGALRRDARYVGLVASPTRAAAVRAWLRDEAGLADDRLAALRAPAGLDLGAETAEEVALSILAELVQVRRGRADFVASPGPATTAAGGGSSAQAQAQGQGVLAAAPDDIVLLDPVCGMTVDRDHARHLAEHDGVVYAFCSLGCRTRFVKEPTAYVAASVSSGG